jgi:hypothetical protein
MKITKRQLRKIIKEELEVLKELGPVTGHEEGTNAVGVVKEVGDSLIEVGKMMQGLPSTRAASEFGGFIESLGKESLEAHAELADLRDALHRVTQALADVVGDGGGPYDHLVVDLEAAEEVISRVGR